MQKELWEILLFVSVILIFTYRPVVDFIRVHGGLHTYSIRPFVTKFREWSVYLSNSLGLISNHKLSWPRLIYSGAKVRSETPKQIDECERLKDKRVEIVSPLTWTEGRYEPLNHSNVPFVSSSPRHHLQDSDDSNKGRVSLGPRPDLGPDKEDGGPGPVHEVSFTKWWSLAWSV